jgi:hypothetical protein
MNKRKLLALGMIAMMMVVGLILASCDDGCRKAAIGNCYSSGTCIDINNCGTFKSTLKTDACDC